MVSACVALRMSKRIAFLISKYQYHFSIIDIDNGIVKCEMTGDPEGTRTLNPQNRNLILYPIELRDQEMLNFEYRILNF
jgi:hypothetical protein